MNPPTLAVVRSTAPLTAAEARALTDRIRSTAEDLASLLHEAYERQAWRALGYDSWRAYATTELSISQSRAYELLDRARVVSAIEEAGGQISDASEISARDVRAIKPQLAEVTEEIRERVEAGEPPAEVVEAVITERREERRAERREAEARTEISTTVETEPADPEAYDPEADFDEGAELLHALEENQRLRAQIDALSTDDTAAELRTWMEKYARLEGRVQQLQRTAREAQQQAERQGRLLKAIRAKLGLERDSEIIPALDRRVR